MNRPSAMTSAAICLLLAGCGSARQTAFDLVGVEIPLTALESRDFNGSYQGTIHQASTNAPTCPTESGENVIMVGDGVLWYAYSPTQLFTVPVLYDGTLSAKSGDTDLVGRIKGNYLRMTIKSPQCQTNIAMHYVYNHS